MKTISSKTAKKLVAATTIPAALILSGLAVAQASYSAYSAATVNPTSNWTSGTVALTDDDANTALFTASNLKPGATGSQCINVTSTGSLASAVKLYGTGYATTNDLASQISLTVQQGSGGSFGSCTNFVASTTNPTLYSGTLAAFGTGSAAKISYATGIGDWAPTGSSSDARTYKVTYTLSSSSPNSSQTAPPPSASPGKPKTAEPNPAATADLAELLTPEPRSTDLSGEPVEPSGGKTSSPDQPTPVRAVLYPTPVREFARASSPTAVACAFTRAAS